MKKFIERNIEEQEREVQYQIYLINEGGITDEIDGPSCARLLCRWSASLLEEQKPFPPSLSKWLSSGLISAIKEDPEPLEKSLGLKRKKGAKKQRDKHLEIKIAIAKIVIKENISKEAAMQLLADHMRSFPEEEEPFSYFSMEDLVDHPDRPLTYDGIKKIVYNKEDIDVDLIIKDLKPV